MYQIPSISLDDALKYSTYKNKPFVAHVIINTSRALSKVLLLTRLEPYQRRNNETIFLIHQIIPVNFNKKIFNVEILIYLPSDFPKRPPEFYFQKKEQLSVEKEYLITPNERRDLLINLAKYSFWEGKLTSLKTCIDQLGVAFSKKFPCFRSLSQVTTPYKGSCEYNERAVRQVILPNAPIQSPQYKQDPLSSRVEGCPPPQPISYSQPMTQTKKVISLSQVREALEKEILFKIKPHLGIYLFNLFTTKNALIQMRTRLQSANKNSNDVEIAPIITRMQAMVQKYSDEEQRLEQEIKDVKSNKSNKGVSLINIKSLIDIKTPKMLDYICKENAIFEFLHTIKKATQKKSFDFPELVKQYRMLSNELFVLQYLEKKELNQNLFGKIDY